MAIGQAHAPFSSIFVAYVAVPSYALYRLLSQIRQSYLTNCNGLQPSKADKANGEPFQPITSIDVKNGINMNTTDNYSPIDLTPPTGCADALAAQQMPQHIFQRAVRAIGKRLQALRQPPLKYALVSFWAFCTLIVAALSMSSHGILPDYHHIDKVAHFSAYFSLAILPTFLSNNTKHIIIVICALTLLGLGLEGLQSMLPNRSSSLYDLLANLLGLSFGSAIGLGIRQWTNRIIL